jgi:hypothetical protein
MSIYININQQQEGPYSPDQINKMLQNGQISPESPAWTEGMPNWQPLSTPVFAQIGIILSPPETNNLGSIEQQFNSGVAQDPRRFSVIKAIGDAFAFFMANPVGSMAYPIISFILSPTGIGFFLVPLTGVNLLACAKNYQMTQKKMALGELFDFSGAVEKILGPIVIGFIIVVGFVFLIVPGAIFSLWWAFTPCVQADRPTLSFTDSMKESRIAAKGNWLNMLLLFILLGFLQVLGALCLGIGLLITIPVAHLALYFAYIQCKKRTD